jgi:hypothetical protein
MFIITAEKTCNLALFSLYLAVTPVPVTTQNWKLPPSGKYRPQVQSNAYTPNADFSIGNIFTGEVRQVQHQHCYPLSFSTLTAMRHTTILPAGPALSSQKLNFELNTLKIKTEEKRIQSAVALCF